MRWNYIKHNCLNCNVAKDIRIDVHNKLQKENRQWRCNRCVASETRTKLSTTHGKYGTPEYRSWLKMKDRCLNPNHKYYSLYGGRGITVATEWLSFEGFYRDMGNMPKANFSLDRIDNNLGYFKENCRWIPKNHQQKNRRNTRAPYIVPEAW